jgi:hypothetical protein
VKQVLIIGAGKRVLGGYLPALRALRDRYQVAGIVATERRELEIYDGTRLTTMDRLPDARADLVLVAVPPRHVAGVISELAKGDVATTTLMLDTPVLPARGLWVLPKLRAFQRVLVAEDTIALPPFTLARRLIDAGEIGELRRILFFHCGYRYHALASLKRLAAAPISRLVGQRYVGKRRIKDLSFANGVTATMFEPRDYAIGHFLIEGTRGAIADYDLARDHVRRISYVLDGPLYRGLQLDGVAIPPTDLDQRFLAALTPSIPEVTPMNAMKIRGLVELLAAALTPQSPWHYSVPEGLADGLIIDTVDRAGYVPKPAWWAKALAIPA